MEPRRAAVGLVVAALACAVLAGPACAELSDAQRKCIAGITKASRTFVNDRTKALAQCKDADLKAPASCDTAKRDTALAKAAAKLAQGLEKSCSFDGDPARQAANFEAMGFPGECADANPGDGFTTGDLRGCLELTHSAIAGALLEAIYDPTVTGALAPDVLACQGALSKSGRKLLACALKRAQDCRLSIVKGKIQVLPERCRDEDTKTRDAIEQCAGKAAVAIVGKCTDAHAASLKACTPDQTSASDAAECLVDAVLDSTDSLDRGAPADLVDYELADPPLCGDNRVNRLDEECDGTDAAACPGQCGTPETPDGYFACLCTSKPRQLVVEHANADLDLGWTGIDHDLSLVEGGGYLADLSDCDGAGTCIVGPSCSLPPHAPCAPSAGPPLTRADSICADLNQGTCRKERTAAGPHCSLDIQQECDPQGVVDTFCAGGSNAGSACRPGIEAECAGGAQEGRACTPGVASACAGGPNAGAPCLQASECPAGTCEAVCPGGTCELVCPSGTCEEICPGAGNFCVTTLHGPPLPVSAGGVSVCIVRVFSEDVVGTTNVLAGGAAVRLRENLVTHAGASLGTPCPVCGGFCAGSREACEVGADCGAQGPCVTEAVCSAGPNRDQPCRVTPPFGGTAGLPGTTSVDCPPFRGTDISAGGLDLLLDPLTTGTVSFTPSVTCAAEDFAGDACVGGPSEGRPCTAPSDCPSGACTGQCFCAGQAAPTACNAACVGGLNDGKPCETQSACPSGFCHPGDCRVDPADTDSAQEGRCSVPTAGACFVNGGILRQGAAGVPGATMAGVACLPPTTNSSVNAVAGLPAPAALTQPVTTITVP